MNKEKLPHTLPKDFKEALNKNPKVKALWDDITPLARNEFICWVISAKKDETRDKRIAWACDSLLQGKRRPCCWVGCGHRL
ncbi:MAG TPA: YdeI/OmpD-associated family protein [Candidatus Paceibacterota bacterium]|nr:YdeI/OmpD-associated family protein [Candidatus Paceibacterota bacterium]